MVFEGHCIVEIKKGMGGWKGSFIKSSLYKLLLIYPSYALIFCLETPMFSEKQTLCKLVILLPNVYLCGIWYIKSLDLLCIDLHTLSIKMKYSVATLSFIATYLISSLYSATEDEDQDEDEARQKRGKLPTTFKFTFPTVAHIGCFHHITLNQDFHLDQIVELSIYQNNKKIAVVCPTKLAAISSHDNRICRIQIPNDIPTGNGK